MDCGQQTPCCQFSEDEVIETDGDQFDCQDCPVMDARDQLLTVNEDAWGLFHRAFTRLGYDMGTAASVIAKVLSDRDVDDALDLNERLSLIYDVLYPPKKPQTK